MFRDEWAAIKRALPSVTVLVIVLLLLRGVTGTCAALWLQVTTLAQSFLGGGDTLAAVLLHTLPLAIAAAAASFLIFGGWIKFEGVGSFLVLAILVIAGATVGGVLQQFASAGSTSRPATQPDQTHQRFTAPRETSQVQLASGTSLPGTPSTAATARSGPLTLRDNQPQQSLFQAEATPGERLRSIDWWAEPNLHDSPATDLSPVPLLPKSRGIVGVLFMAVNQLLGFLVAYQPRLFLAAILAGSWTGYLWQRRLCRWCQAEG